MRWQHFLAPNIDNIQKTCCHLELALGLHDYSCMYLKKKNCKHGILALFSNWTRALPWIMGQIESLTSDWSKYMSLFTRLYQLDYF